eukprot:scaffold323_cov91-Cyclotella_meneghiniana.AAC.2
MKRRPSFPFSAPLRLRLFSIHEPELNQHVPRKGALSLLQFIPQEVKIKNVAPLTTNDDGHSLVRQRIKNERRPIRLDEDLGRH